MVFPDVRHVALHLFLPDSITVDDDTVLLDVTALTYDKSLFGILMVVLVTVGSVAKYVTMVGFAVKRLLYEPSP